MAIRAIGCRHHWSKVNMQQVDKICYGGCGLLYQMGRSRTFGTNYKTEDNKISMEIYHMHIQNPLCHC